MDFKVYGCKVNKFYITKWMKYFEQHPHFLHGDRFIIATCVVTDRAKSKRVKDAKKRLKNGQKVYLTGCGAFEKGQAMDYDKFFAIYPDLEEYKNSLYLLGEDPDVYNENLEVGEYELNKEIGSPEEAIEITKKISPLQPAGPVGRSKGRTDDSLYTRTMARLEEKKRNSTMDSGSSPEGPSDDPLYTRKFIVIQSGCDTFCTFCLTIYKRGSTRNRPADEIIEEINEFVAQGGQEIIITGVNLAAYGSSNTRKPDESEFSDLLERILAETSVQRIRISSLGPEFLDDKFFSLMENTRFLPHFHFSIQSFSNKVLKLMNRNYDTAVLDDVLTKIRQLERPDADSISIGADIIVGFPGEGSVEFDETYEAIEKYGITKLHAFPFSPHQKGETVPAGKLPEQVAMHSKKERERRLLAEGERVRNLFLQKEKGKEFVALLETNKDGRRQGWTENYIQVDLEGDYQRGQLVEITL